MPPPGGAGDRPARQRIGPDLAAHGRVAASVLAGRIVSRLRLPADARAANLESDRASDRYGVTGELTAMTPYDVTQQWAGVLHRAGFGGVTGRVRFTLSRHRGLGIFGIAGEQPDWPADPSPVRARDVAARMTIDVIDPPDDDQTTVIDPGSPRLPAARSVRRRRTTDTARHPGDLSKEIAPPPGDRSWLSEQW